MENAQLQLFVFTAGHLASLTLAVAAAYVFLRRAEARASSVARSSVTSEPGEQSAIVFIGGAYAISILVGMATLFVETLFAPSSYHELLDAFTFNHWIIGFIPTWSAIVHHPYSGAWLDRIFSEGSAS